MQVSTDKALGAEQNGSRDNHPSRSFSKVALKRYFDVAVVFVVIAVVWGLLALPTIFYHLPQVSCVV